MCFQLFDRTPHAWAKVAQWSGKRDEFVKRARRSRCWRASPATTRSRRMRRSSSRLPLIERAATDERNFVKKGVSWALRRIGRRNARLHAAAVAMARRLAASSDAAARWIGKDALRDIERPAVLKRFAK